MASRGVTLSETMRYYFRSSEYHGRDNLATERLFINFNKELK